MLRGRALASIISGARGAPLGVGKHAGCKQACGNTGDQYLVLHFLILIDSIPRNSTAPANGTLLSQFADSLSLSDDLSHTDNKHYEIMSNPLDRVPSNRSSRSYQGQHHARGYQGHSVQRRQARMKVLVGTAAQGYSPKNCRLILWPVNAAIQCWGLETYLAIAEIALENMIPWNRA